MSIAPVTARDIQFRSTTLERASIGLSPLLWSIVRWLGRFVVITNHQAVAIALWVAHTHAFDAADCTPYLQITSATKRAGKTRLLEVLEPLVARPWFTGRTSAAALVRKVDRDCPTLLLDESDAAFSGDADYAESLRGQLNSGYRRSGMSTLCVGQGAKIDIRDFKTFSPKAIAGIGELPGTVADRAIRIELRRRTQSEVCERWRQRRHREEGHALHAAVSAWANRSVELLQEAEPDLPSSLSDRAADVWEPLLAIADLAGGDWPALAREAAETLSGQHEEADINVELLWDVRSIYAAEDCAFLASTAIVEKLAAMKDRPWADWRNGKPITTRALADRLKKFRIEPQSTGTTRGYYRDRFEDAWGRYPSNQASTRQNASV